MPEATATITERDPLALVESAIDELFEAAERLLKVISAADWGGRWTRDWLSGRVDGLRQAHGYEFQEVADFAWNALDGVRQAGSGVDVPA